MKKLVFIGNDTLLTTSLIVAEKFEKRHDRVLQTIEEQYGDLHEFVEMFHKATYPDKYGRPQPMYTMNRDGFFMLVSGFTGEKAKAFRLEFLKAFNKMEDALKKLGAAEVQRLQLRELGKKIGRRPVTDAIQRFNQRDFKDGDKNPQARARYAGFTKRTQMDVLGIPKGGRDMADGAMLAALTLAEKNSASILNNTFETGGSWNQAETISIELFHHLRHLADGQYSKLQLMEANR